MISMKSRTTQLKLAISKDEYRVDQIHVVHSKEYGPIFIMSQLVFDQLEEGYIRTIEEPKENIICE